MLGMYHCINPAKNEFKFYHVLWDSNEKHFVCKYGRINQTPRTQIYHKSHEEMAKFVRTKLKKGYKFVSGYEEKIGNRTNALEYILSLDTGL